MHKLWILLVLCGLCLSQSFKESFDLHVEDYELYPDTLFEAVEHRQLQPSELLDNSHRSRTATAFTRSFARKYIPAGQRIVTLDSSHAITRNTILSEIPELGNYEFSYPEEIFVAWFLVHHKIGDISRHHPFISSFPKDIVNPLLFTPDTWTKFPVELEGVKLSNFVASKRETLVAAFHKLMTHITQHPIPLLSMAKSPQITGYEYVWSYIIITDLISFSPKETAIYPALNFGHGRKANTIDIIGDKIVITAKNDIEPGEQIFVHYGEFSNRNLLMFHSMYIHQNPDDCVEFTIKVDNEHWSAISQKYFGTTGNEYSNCIPMKFNSGHPILASIRTMFATKEELKNIETILSGSGLVSLDNEVTMLRNLIASIYNQPKSKYTEEPTEIALQFWKSYIDNYEEEKDTVIQRLKDLWDQYLLK